MSAPEVTARIDHDAKTAYLGLESISTSIRITAQGYDQKLKEQKQQIVAMTNLIATRSSDLKATFARGYELENLAHNHFILQNQCSKEIKYYQDLIDKHRLSGDAATARVAECQRTTAAAIATIVGSTRKAAAEAELKNCLNERKLASRRRKKLADFQPV